MMDDLNGKIKLKGFVTEKELIEHFLKAEIFYFPSRGIHLAGREGSPLVLIEAVYFNNAIVASNVGASEYVLDHGKAGLIFENENIDDFSSKLEDLMKNEHLRKELADNARVRCEKLFTWERIVSDLSYRLIELSKNKNGYEYSSDISGNKT